MKQIDHCEHGALLTEGCDDCGLAPPIRVPAPFTTEPGVELNPAQKINLLTVLEHQTHRNHEYHPDACSQILSDEEVDQAEARHKVGERAFQPYKEVTDSLRDVPALCHTVRALRAAWCVCGHLKTSHDRFEDHDECRGCPNDGPPDSCSEFRADTSRPSLTKQLAAAEQELTNLRADTAHLNERLGIQEGHCKRLQEELTRAVRGWK